MAESLEARLGYRFHDTRLLQEALTHPSSGVRPDNQRQEFLGDALLQATLSLLLVREKPTWDEGALSKLRHLMVNTEALCAWARDLDLRLVLPSKGDPSHLKTAFRKPMADAVEALLAAVFLDAAQQGMDGFQQVLGLVEGRYLAAIRAAQADTWKEHDAKSRLQEEAARLGLSAPEYERLGQEGPDHAPRFRVQVRVGDQAAEGVAGSLKLAQAEAARRILNQLSPAPPPAAPRPGGKGSGKIARVRQGKARP